MRATDQLHDNFLQTIAESTHYKYLSKAHTDALFLEIGQYNRKRGNYPTNGYWTNPNIKVLVYGNEKIRYYFDRDKLFQWIQNNNDKIGYYLDNKVKGISLSITESRKLADMVV